MVIRRGPAAMLAGRVTSYYGFEEATPEPVRQREGPGVDVVVILTFEEHWLIDGERHTSFVGGLRDSQVTTEHPGRSLGMQINLDPLAARALVGAPLDELAHRTVPLEHVLEMPFLLEQLAEADWGARFALLDETLARRLADAHPSAEVTWAWQRLRATHGRHPIGALATELGWSRKRIVARFRDEIGLPPKSVARLLRFERARALAGTMPWGELAYECGFSDQSHLIAEFRRITGRTPETFSKTRWRRRPSLRAMEQHVIPYPLYEDGPAAIEFLTEAFGFREKMRTGGDGGGFHAELEIAPGGAVIYLGQPADEFRNPAVVGKTCLVYAIVEDVDGHYARAKAAGAQIVAEPSDQSYGHRHYGCTDPQGHEWWFAQPINGANA